MESPTYTLWYRYVLKVLRISLLVILEHLQQQACFFNGQISTFMFIKHTKMRHFPENLLTMSVKKVYQLLLLFAESYLLPRVIKIIFAIICFLERVIHAKYP